jgi:L-amino acid N-acyltransferase YncA/DNA-binding transcriptional ArsR family regulator
MQIDNRRMTTTASPPLLPVADATTYAGWFACLAEPMRVRLLHAVAVATGPVTVGELTEQLGISQATCSHHVRKLADAGFLRVRKDGTATLITVNAACCTGLPHAADAVMGILAPRPCRPDNLPSDVHVRALRTEDWPGVRRLYGDGIATGDATFDTDVPSRVTLDATWLPGHRWVAHVGDALAGWAAITAASTRSCYAGVGETSVYVGDGFRGRGVGKALLHQQVSAADADDLWTLQTSIFPENRAGLALHHAAGFRTLGVRERIAHQHGVWRDTVFLERRRSQDPV